MSYELLLRLYMKFYLRIHRNLVSKLGTKIFGIHPKNIFNYRYQFFVNNVDERSIVLDIACGTGLISYMVSFKAKRVIGIDFDIKNLEISQNRFSRKNITYIHADLFNIDYNSLQIETGYNIVILSHILEHIKDTLQLLEQIKAEKILICVPSQENWETHLLKYLKLPYKKDQTHFREYTKKMLTRDLSKAGYEPDFMGYNSEGEIICKASKRKI